MLKHLAPCENECVCFTLVYAAAVRRFVPSHSSKRRPTCGPLAHQVAAIDALPGAEANMGGRAGADVGRRVGQPREVLGLGGRHREADRRHDGWLKSGLRDRKLGKWG